MCFSKPRSSNMYILLQDSRSKVLWRHRATTLQVLKQLLLSGMKNSINTGAWVQVSQCLSMPVWDSFFLKKSVSNLYLGLWKWCCARWSLVRYCSRCIPHGQAARIQNCRYASSPSSRNIFAALCWPGTCLTYTTCRYRPSYHAGNMNTICFYAVLICCNFWRSLDSA